STNVTSPSATSTPSPAASAAPSSPSTTADRTTRRRRSGRSGGSRRRVRRSGWRRRRGRLARRAPRGPVDVRHGRAVARRRRSGRVRAMADRNLQPWLARLASRTPTVPLHDAESGCTIWLKLEYLRPSGSTKDRVATFVLAHAMASGALTQESIVVEASSGSTSIAFAMGCAMLGVRFVAVMPRGVSGERVLIIRRYGGEVILTDPERGVLGAIEESRAMAARDPRVFLPRQFENPLNALAHQRATGPELIAQVDGTIHGFVAGVGTGGTL